MRTFTQITISFEDQPRGNIAIPRMKLIINNMIGAFLILIIALTLIVTLLLPNVLDAIQYAMLSPGIAERILVLADLLLLGFLLAVPTTFLVWSLLDYRNARNLTRLGVMTKGSLLDKWADTSGPRPVYHVHYRYLAQFDATQTVDEDVFQQLKRDENIFVLHLEHLPHISRLELD